MKVWEKQVKPVFDGFDTSVHLILGKRDYVFVRHPQYYAMRPWKKDTTEQLLSTMSILQKLKWRALRLR